MTELKKWENPIENKQSFPYLQYTPLKYNKDTNTGKWPLLVCLHGAGERGDDGSLIHFNLPFDLAKPEQGEGLPFFMVAPQCPKGKYWGCFIESLNDYLDYIIEVLPIDPKRVYLTGLSMGGTGTWGWGIANPERFAAIIPVCGTGICWNTEMLKTTPVWAHHGTVDSCIPASESIDMVNRIRCQGGNARLSLYEGVDHDSWIQAYSNLKLYKWMLEQTL
ncbi:MAG: dienelactone hydrolase family protein [Oscillospiraceae bacterium]|nr:dienelactone hydrolase family protein [Oscillospiraceae bacterium]